MKKITSTFSLIAFCLISYAQISLNISYQTSLCDSGVWVSIFINGGVQPYVLIYDWNDGNLTTSTIQGSFDSQYYTYDTAGIYALKVSVTDSGGDTASSSINIIYNNPVSFNVNVNVQNHFCDPCGGTVSISPTGGLPPYSAYWSNGAQGLNQNNLCSGLYWVSVIDSSNCIWSDSIVVKNSSALQYEITDPSCNTSDGSIAVIADTLANQFSYQWSTGSTDSFITGLSSGGYALIVSGPCVYLDSFFLFDSCGEVNGIVYEDKNGNGSQDPGESGLSGVKVTLIPDNIKTYTDANGSYSINTPGFNTYTIIVDPPYFYIDNCLDSFPSFIPLQGTVTDPPGSSHSVNITSGNPVSQGNDFGVQPPSDNCATITGQVFEDLNASGFKDLGEPGYAGAYVQNSLGGLAVTDMMGNYSMSIPMNASVTVSLAPGYTGYYCNAVSQSYSQTFPPANGDYTFSLTASNPDTSDIDFGVELSNPNYDVGVYTIWTTQSITAGTQLSAWMDFKASGTITTDCVLRMDFDPVLSYVSSSVTPSVVGNDYLEWTYPPGTAPSWYCMNIIFYLDSSVTAGYNLEFTGSYGCSGNDACAYNDTLIRNFDVDFGTMKTSNGPVSMFSFLPQKEMPYLISQADSVFSFLISYQNNTGSHAARLVIENPVSEHLDINTISFPFSSHHFEMTIAENNTVLLEFNNIDIPDSSVNELMSYGFVQYNIEAKRNLPLGTEIVNKAKIAWNGYDPVWTNEIIHKMGSSSTGDIGQNEDAILIFPNPTHDYAIIDLRSINENILELNLYSLIGEKIMSNIKFDDATVYLNTKNLSSGVYLIQVETKSRVVSSKLVIK